jgi:beta-phosphoglucomutase family hydrolase
MPIIRKIDTKLVIFDLDGVISDTSNLHLIAWKETLDNYLFNLGKGKVKLSYRVFLDYIDGKPRKKGINDYMLLNKIKLAKKNVEDISQKKNIKFQQLINKKIKAFPDSLRLIRNLKKKNIKIALASSSKNCRLIIKNLKIQKKFNYIIDGNDLEKKKLPGKPKPDIFRQCYKSLKIDKNLTCIIEDSLSGLLAAKSAGVKKVVGIIRPGKIKKKLERAKPHILINSLDNLKIK